MDQIYLMHICYLLGDRVTGSGNLRCRRRPASPIRRTNQAA